MSMMQFDLVSPERSLASLQAQSVLIPGAEGDITVMADHAPVITTLRPGVLVVTSDQGEQKYAVFGGFAQIAAEGMSVLAERAIPVADASAEEFDAVVKTAESAVNGKQGAQKDAAEKTLADLNALRAELAL